ncbi:MAG: hypothetical protein IJ366_03720 [Clostridia bacterium]|nr:hypothetical protein [Clostridia bacterium]
MILFIGEKALYDFVCTKTADVTYDIGIESAEKLIVCDCSDAAVAAVRAAILINIPVLGILGGYQAVAEGFGARCEMLENCAEGRQEWAVTDNSSPIFSGLEKVIRICRGAPVAVIEATLPAELDCIARAETGEIIAFASYCAPNIQGNIFAVNLHPASGLTPDGGKIIENFINLQK